MKKPVIINYEPVGIQKLKLLAKQFYNEKLHGLKVINMDKGITALFSSVGRNHVLYARNAGFEKLIAIFKLPEIVQNAKFTNFKNPDARDAKNVIGFMNFKCPVKINGVMQYFRVVVRISTDGKFFYDHSVKVKK
jgi:hypothetical protein